MSIFSNERYDDHESAIRTAFEGMAAGTWTAEPGIIQGALADDGTTTVQLATMGTVNNPDGTQSFVTIATLQHCPVKFMGGGGLYITHPIADGDECLVVFAKRCIDNWWQQGGVQKPFAYHMHDINDGFCIPGFFSKPNAMANVSMSSIQIRTKAGDVIADINDTTITFNKNVVVNASVMATGDIIADSAGGFVSLVNHLTSNVMPQTGGVSGPPVPGT